MPLGRHAKGPSRPGNSSEVADSLGSEPDGRENIRICLRANEVSGYESSEETAKNAASPRKVIEGRPSSVGWESDAGRVEDEGSVTRAAPLPNEPWNWVDLDPQPTLTNLSTFNQLGLAVCQMIVLTFAELV